MDEEKKQQSHLRSLIKKNLYKIPPSFQVSKTMHDQVGLSFNDDLDTLTDQIHIKHYKKYKAPKFFWVILVVLVTILMFSINFVWALGILIGLIFGVVSSLISN